MEIGNCNTCKYYAEISTWNYTIPNVPKMKAQGYACLGLLLTEDGDEVIQMIGLNPEIETCEIYKCKNRKFAKLYEVEYKWPDQEEWTYGTIIYTNMNDECKAAAICGTYDEYVLIYTDSLDKEDIKKNFDGLEIKILQEV